MELRKKFIRQIEKINKKKYLHSYFKRNLYKKSIIKKEATDDIIFHVTQNITRFEKQPTLNFGLKMFPTSYQ